PGGEGSADADGLAEHHLADFGAAGQNHPAVDAAALFRVPVAVVGAADDFADGFGQRLALVEREVAADFLGALAGKLPDLAQDLGTLHGRTVAPGLEGAGGRGQGAVEIGGGGVGEMPQHLEVRGVGDLLRVAAVPVEEFTVYI